MEKTRIKAKKGDRVRVHYTGWLEDDSVFDSSREGEPLEFTVGKGGVVAELERKVIGMSPGERKTITLSPEEGFGERREDLVMELPRNRFPKDLHLSVGDSIELRQGEDKNISVRIERLDADKVTVDANLPLAGKTLKIELELLEILPRN
jgi:peptidylprolyl isomerase